MICAYGPIPAAFQAPGFSRTWEWGEPGWAAHHRKVHRRFAWSMHMPRARANISLSR